MDKNSIKYYIQTYWVIEAPVWQLCDPKSAGEGEQGKKANSEGKTQIKYDGYF